LVSDNRAVSFKVRPCVCVYVIFPITYLRQLTYDILPYTLISLYDENKLCVSYLQPELTKGSTECVVDSRKQYKRLTENLFKF